MRHRRCLGGVLLQLALLDDGVRGPGRLLSRMTCEHHSKINKRLKDLNEKEINTYLACRSCVYNSMHVYLCYIYILDYTAYIIYMISRAYTNLNGLSRFTSKISEEDHPSRSRSLAFRSGTSSPRAPIWAPA